MVKGVRYRVCAFEFCKYGPVCASSICMLNLNSGRVSYGSVGYVELVSLVLNHSDSWFDSL